MATTSIRCRTRLGAWPSRRCGVPCCRTRRPRQKPPRPRVSNLASTVYRPLSTLAPTSWTPVIEASGDQCAARRRRRRLRRARISRLRRDGDVADRRAPTERRRRTRSTRLAGLLRLRSMASDASSPPRRRRRRSSPGPATDAGTPSAATLLARELEAGVVLPMQQVRVSHRALVSVIHSADEYTRRRPAAVANPACGSGRLADVFGAHLRLLDQP